MNWIGHGTKWMKIVLHANAVPVGALGGGYLSVRLCLK